MYRPLFNIRYQHEYFDHKPLFSLDFAWTVGMDRLINNMGLLILPSDGEVKILFDQSNFDRKTFFHAWSDETLVIYFTPKENRIFYNVTKGLEKLIRSDSPVKGTDDRKSKHFRLYQYDAEDTTAMDGVDLPVTALDTIKNLEDFGGLGETMVSELVDNKKNLTENEKIKNKSSSGADIDVSTIKKIATNQTLFVVSIKVKELSKFINESEKTPNLTLQFKSIEAHYKYYFTAMLPDKNLKIVADDDKGIDYHALEDELVGDRSIAAFISNKPLTLRWQHKKHFKLVRQVKNVSQTLIENLPHPDPTRCYKHKEPDKDSINVVESFIN